MPLAATKIEYRPRKPENGVLHSVIRDHFEELEIQSKFDYGIPYFIGADWMFFEKGRFRKLHYAVPSSALVVVGAYGHSVIKEMVLGSKMEEIQNVLPNNMLVVGPNC